MSTTTVPRDQPLANPISRSRIAAHILHLHYYSGLPMPLGWRQNRPASDILVIELETLADLQEWATWLECGPIALNEQSKIGKLCGSARRNDWHGWHVQLYAQEPLPEPPSPDAELVIAAVLAGRGIPLFASYADEACALTQSNQAA